MFFLIYCNDAQATCSSEYGSLGISVTIGLLKICAVKPHLRWRSLVSRQGENIKNFILGGATTNRIDPDHCMAAQSGKVSASSTAAVESVFPATFHQYDGHILVEIEVEGSVQ